MTTPIYDFCRRYADSGTTRFHMPGHKGAPLLGVEPYDITEIAGADSLYEADGIIAESEANATRLFGVATFYSTEGSSQCIRAMLYLLTVSAGKKITILAGRNTHKTFVTACGLLDIDVHWLYGTGDNYLSCRVTPDEVEKAICSSPQKPTAVYLTSPDYLGNMVDIAGIANVCHKHGVYLAVDCAHGAYLHFLPTTDTWGDSCHPMDLGADLCCASAHKTLPALTGCAYLHLSPALPDSFHQNAKDALALFGSTSPSYLLLCSLDRVNLYLESGYRERLAAHIMDVETCRLSLLKWGYTCVGTEPTKLTLCPKSYGYTGVELAEVLRENHIECEFADPDHLVLMTAPGQAEALAKLMEVLRHLPKRAPNEKKAPGISRKPIVRCTIREAIMSQNETIPVENAAGRVLSALTVGCPPAVPIVVCGEEITEEAVEVIRYYGMDTVKVRRE